jgi:hypothetical protein
MVIDCIERGSIWIEAVLRKALYEQIKLVLMVSKLNRATRVQTLDGEGLLIL